VQDEKIALTGAWRGAREEKFAEKGGDWRPHQGATSLGQIRGVGAGGKGSIAGGRSIERALFVTKIAQGHLTPRLV